MKESDLTVLNQAKDGIEAVALFRPQPDVTLMDLRMLQISTTLNVSESTVKSNINRILSKLGG